MTTNCLNAAAPTQPEMTINKDGHKYWTMNFQFHREDGPAIELTDGTKYWYLHNKFHREDGPAIEWADGSKEWYLHDQRHREDGPAVEYANGDKWWYLHGKEYTETEWKKKVAAMKKASSTSVSSSKSDSTQPVMEVDVNGTKSWKFNGRLHREGGPALEYTDGTKEWWLHGQRHREDGPAIEFISGNKRWYLQDIFYTEAEWKREVAAMKKKTASTPTTKVDSTQPVMEVGKCRHDTKEWKLHGKRHREDGPAVEWPDGYKEWWLHGKLHREDGPAIEYAEGNKWWCRHGKLHREDGPALEYIDGRKYWYLHGTKYSEADWQKEVNKMKRTEMLAQSTSVSDHLKSDLSQGTFRVAAKTIPKTARTALLAFLKAKKVKKSWLISAEEMMSTEWGLAFIQQVLAWSFRSLPQLKEDPRATALANEWAIDSVAVMGNEVIQELTALLTPMMTQVMELPTSQIRIQTTDSEAMEMEESSQQPRAYV